MFRTIDDVLGDVAEGSVAVEPIFCTQMTCRRLYFVHLAQTILWLDALTVHPGSCDVSLAVQCVGNASRVCRSSDWHMQHISIKEPALHWGDAAT